MLCSLLCFHGDRDIPRAIRGATAVAQPQETGTVSRLFDGADPNRASFDPWSPFFLIVLVVVVFGRFRLHPNLELFRAAMLKT